MAQLSIEAAPGAFSQNCSSCIFSWCSSRAVLCCVAFFRMRVIKPLPLTDGMLGFIVIDWPITAPDRWSFSHRTISSILYRQNWLCCLPPLPLFIIFLGPGLAFIAYPKAVSMMPLPSFWAILFFIMLLLLGLDSQFVEVEGQITSLVDLYPSFLRKGYRREIFIAIVCFLSYLLGLTMVTEGGMYIFQLFDYYAASGVCLLWVAFFECIAVAWIYGADKLYDNIEDMIGYRPGPWMKWSWCVITPLLCVGCFIFSLAKYTPLTYNKYYTYPDWAIGVGWALALSSMLCIPLVAIYRIVRSEGSLIERIKLVTAPREVNRWAKESEGSTPFCSNGGHMKPTHVIVETMMWPSVQPPSDERNARSGGLLTLSLDSGLWRSLFALEFWFVDSCREHCIICVRKCVFCITL